MVGDTLEAPVALEVEGLCKRFGALAAVSDLSLAVRRGEVFGFLGPNGAGKTTAIHMMCGLLRPDSGRVLVAGEPIDAHAPEVRARVGVCPQRVVVWPELTCLEQLVFVGEMYGVPRARARERAQRLLAAMGLTDKRHARAKTLSGGMQRRLNLLLALVHEPEIVVLDEPEAGLDPQSRVLVREYIRSLARSKTIILTTHNMDEADRLADRVAIVDHGKLLELDTPDALKRQVGEGDVLELTLADGAGQAVSRALAAVKAVIANATAAGAVLYVRAPAMVERIAEVLAALTACGAETLDVRLRQSTLEDVFIALTGRGLRAS